MISSADIHLSVVQCITSSSFLLQIKTFNFYPAKTIPFNFCAGDEPTDDDIRDAAIVVSSENGVDFGNVRSIKLREKLSMESLA